MTKKTLHDYQDEPAFPCTNMHDNKGITKLEYFSAMALQGCLANSQYRVADHKEIEEYSMTKARNIICEMYNETRTGKKEKDRRI